MQNLKNKLKYIVPTTLGVSTLITVALITVNQSDTFNKMADTVQNNSTANLDEFKNWPMTSMFEFFVIHDSVIHAYNTADTEKTFDIDKNKVLGVRRGQFWMYFEPDSIERSPRMHQVGSMLGLQLTLSEYDAVREYFNKVVPP